MTFISNGSSSKMASFGDLIYVNKAYMLDKKRSGIVRWIGETEFKPGIEWIGFDLFKGEGKNDGTVNGISYFKCEQGRGVFVNIRAITGKISDENLQKFMGIKRQRSRRDSRPIPKEFGGSNPSSRRSSLRRGSSGRGSMEHKQQFSRNDFNWSAFPDRDSAYGSQRSDEMVAVITDAEKEPRMWSQSLPIIQTVPEPLSNLREDPELDEGSSLSIEEDECDNKRADSVDLVTEKPVFKDPDGVSSKSKSLNSLDIQKKRTKMKKVRIPTITEKKWNKKGSKIAARNFFRNLERESMKMSESLPEATDLSKSKYKWEVKNRRYLWPTTGGGVSAMDVKYELKTPPSAPKEVEKVKQFSEGASKDAVLQETTKSSRKLAIGTK